MTEFFLPDCVFLVLLFLFKVIAAVNAMFANYLWKGHVFGVLFTLNND